MRNRLHVILLLPVALSIIPFSWVFAGQVIEIDSDDQFAYAEASFVDRLYLQAAAEYRRFVHFFPHDKRVPEAIYKTGLSLFFAQKYRDAIGEFNALIGRYRENPFAVKAHFMISDCNLQLGNAEQALLDLQNLIRLTDDSDVVDEANYRSGWINLETRKWEASARSFGQVSDAGRQRFQLEALSLELEKEKQIPRKDPALAGILSIVPGGGFLYCGEYRNALVSFLLNGLFIWAAVESFDDDNMALGGLLTVVGFGFYAGNIYGGVNSAHKYNRREENKFIHRLQRNLKVRLSSLKKEHYRHTPSFLLSFQYSF